MLTLVTAGLGVAGSILTIVIWLGSYKRKRRKERMAIGKRIIYAEQELAKALRGNDTDNISKLSLELSELRGSARDLDKKR